MLAAGATPSSHTLPLSVSQIEAAVEIFAELAVAAGNKVMAIWADKPRAKFKADRSPVCAADEAAEMIILRGLAQRLPGIPVVSEEAVSRGEIPETGGAFVLVDPLDGTREFLAASQEFTVNLALIIDGVPVGGVVYAPALGRLWMGAGAVASACDVPTGMALPEPTARQVIRTRKAAASLLALVSRSHPDASSEEFLARIGVTERRCAGSSLKFCLLAEGTGDVYPRCSPTMQWDVAAGDAVLRAAGGVVVDAVGAPLRYSAGADGFKNVPFVAWADATAGRAATLR